MLLRVMGGHGLCRLGCYGGSERCHWWLASGALQLVCARFARPENPSAQLAATCANVPQIKQFWKVTYYNRRLSRGGADRYASTRLYWESGGAQVWQREHRRGAYFEKDNVLKFLLFSNHSGSS